MKSETTQPGRKKSKDPKSRWMWLYILSTLASTVLNIVLIINAIKN